MLPRESLRRVRNKAASRPDRCAIGFTRKVKSAEGTTLGILTAFLLHRGSQWLILRS
ncbi:protein of unknown function [Methylocaldum szegediense]|uniref:Transposase n=1 Tax=Methylocaldum szegediense TaxID=73780 RepID=A0ABM9I419_9GAMM|nr:protein of unknown function [Methylocaldum szegediense]